MTAIANRKSENIFKRLVALGVYRVCKNGNVYKNGSQVGYVTNGGYVATAVKIRGCTYHILLHRLVYLTHVGPIRKGLVINHKDGNKSNNSIVNLEAVSESENSKHALRIGLRTHASISGCKNYRSNLTVLDVRKIRKLYDSGVLTNKTELGRLFGVSKTSIREIVLRKSYTNI